MKTLLAIIAAASLVVGCGVIEEEQTTTDTGVSISEHANTNSDFRESTPKVGVEQAASGGSHPCAIVADRRAQF